MNIQPHAKRKTELLWILHPETRAAIPFPPPTPPESFAARIVLPRFFADLIIHDDRMPHVVRPRIGKNDPNAYSRIVQHQFRVRTTPDPVQDDDFSTIRDREYILDVLHPYIFRETERIVQCASRNELYAPTIVPDCPLAPRWSRAKRDRFRTSEGYQPHSGIDRAVLIDTLATGARDLAQEIYDALSPRWRNTGYVSPQNYTTAWLTRERHRRNLD